MWAPKTYKSTRTIEIERLTEWEKYISITFCMTILCKSAVEANQNLSTASHSINLLCVCVCWRIRNEFFNIHLFEFCECDSQTYVQTLTYYDFFFFFFSQFEFRVLSLTWNTTVIFKLGECARSPIQRITAVVFAYDSYNLVLIDSLLRAQRLSIVRAACVFILDFRSFIDSLIVFFFHF